MKCEILIRSVEEARAIRYGWCVMTKNMVARSRPNATVKHRKTALRQARRVAAKLGLEAGK